MKLISTRNQNTFYSLADALTLGLAPDGGLFMPLYCTPLDRAFYDRMGDLSQIELLKQVSHHLLGDTLDRSDIDELIEDSISFPSPVVKLNDGLFALELFHGPSLAFKDFGAQFMARILNKLRRMTSQLDDLLVLVATSGDTGGAVAAGFADVPGIKVAILFPKDGVSALQEKQLTTFGDNVHAIEIDGSFDDCQTLVKTCFNDQALRKQLNITSANSINIGRLIPQTFYYFDAVRQLESPLENVVFSVPSGNFGNLTAGLMSKSMGLPIRRFLAATNANDIVPQWLRTGSFEPRPSIRTVSNAMDVGNPSNFDRMLHLFDCSTWNISPELLLGFTFSDEETLDQIKQTYLQYQYLIDPHGAISILAANQYLNSHPEHCVIALQTAHASKFQSTVEKAIGQDIALHPILSGLLDKPGQKSMLPNNYQNLKNLLLSL